ncbi:MAG TPA: potassium transporter Kup [Gemmatimonas aurantiaca]|uniref:Probable potassium transport system protein Kup n=3 Tax=Gemmatimonas aurantiaca TaxID=173480 RepID=C1A5Q5_GEMAT|nr:putative potassium transport system protein Kup [Gemmatimonas aurantiaca T-27]HCT58597.1 potassium transporter Kup [Gemmatimonas aurantiaca]
MFPAATVTSSHRDEHPTGKRLAVLTLTALGVVYGDIGTSPLYSIKECFSPLYGLEPTRENVFGILSMIVWALTLVVTVKYVGYVLRADNRGEGGTFALLALIFPRGTPQSFAKGGIFVALALFGTALLYGDGIITPAMTVLGAMEGLEVAFPQLAHYIVPFSVVILTALFVVQRYGTDLIGKAFAPIMVIWFVVIATLGLVEIVHSPWILAAVNPMYAVHFVQAHEKLAFFVLGSVVLVITGGEALYADMGHFGRRPISIAWLVMVFPALLLNYFGQGALLVRLPEAAENPFFMLAPRALLLPLLVLATLAAVVASQAMISGAFSVTRQGIALGFIPRLEIKHTSQKEEGQIYIPEVNWFIAVGCLIIVVAFKNTSALGAAYGIAVTGTMLITSVLFYLVARIRFRWKPWQAILLAMLFLSVDLVFFSANVVKLAHGGWVPMVLGVVLFVLMLTWKRGRALLMQRLAEGTMPITLFLDGVAQSKVHRVPGTAVFMTGNDDGVPPVLLHHLKHNKVLHERVLLVSVKTADIPETSASERVRVLPLGHGFWRVIASYGFMQTPNVPQILEVVDQMGIRCKPMETSYFLGRERLIPIPAKPGDKITLSKWRKIVFSIMARNARSATDFFNIPPNRVVELGTQIEF